jgi:hypothetical protein
LARVRHLVRLICLLREGPRCGVQGVGWAKPLPGPGPLFQFPIPSTHPTSSRPVVARSLLRPAMPGPLPFADRRVHAFWCDAFLARLIPGWSVTKMAETWSGWLSMAAKARTGWSLGRCWHRSAFGARAPRARARLPAFSAKREAQR